MLKQYITLSGVISFSLILMSFLVSFIYPEYTRYFYYVAIIIMIPFIIVDLIKKRKEDKIEGTQHFKLSIYNILIAAAIMGVLVFLIHSDYPTSF